MNEEFDAGYEAAYMEPSYNDEEEAHFHWTIQDFEDLVKRYGATQVARNMKPEYAIKLLGALQHELL